MSLIFHAFPPSPRSFKILAVANHLGLDYQLHVVDLVKGDQKGTKFAALNPNGRAPVIEDGDFVLWESNAILQYLAAKKPGLMPLDERGRADVIRWLFWDSCHWDPACVTFIFENIVKQLVKAGPPDAAEIARGEPKFARVANVLDEHLKTHRFIGGDKPNVADFAVAAPLNYTKEAGIPLARHVEIRRWYDEMSALPAWRATLEGLRAAA